MSNLQDKSQSLQKKSDSIQILSSSLNDKLKQEILIQQKTNRSANDLVSNMKSQNEKEMLNYKNSLALSYDRLQQTDLYIYSGFKILNIDNGLTADVYKNKIKAIQNRISEIKNSNYARPKYKASDSINNLFNSSDSITRLNIIDLELKRFLKSDSDRIIGLSNELTDFEKFADSVQKTSFIFDQTENHFVQLLANDSVKLLTSLKEFYQQTYMLLRNEIGNPILYSDTSLLNLWVKHYDYISTCQNKTNLYGNKFTTIDKVNEIIEKHKIFLNKLVTFKIKEIGTLHPK